MSDFIDRLKVELTELEVKTKTLECFIQSEAYKNISDIQADLLIEQLEAMLNYKGILSIRLAHLNKDLRKNENE